MNTIYGGTAKSQFWANLLPNLASGKGAIHLLFDLFAGTPCMELNSGTLPVIRLTQDFFNLKFKEVLRVNRTNHYRCVGPASSTSYGNNIFIGMH